MSKPLRTMVLRTFGTALLATLAACGGGGVIPGTDATQLRALPADYFTRAAVAYSPYRTSNNSTEVITPAELTQDLNLLAQGKFGLIRLYESSDMVAKQTLEAIQANSLDIKVHLGCWIATEEYAAPAQVPVIEAANQAEIARCIALATAYPTIVEAVSVGNECMVDWSGNPVPPAMMVGYIGQVRAAVPQPVTTDDNYAFFAAAPANVMSAIDFVSLHTYALTDSLYGLWDWQQTPVSPDQRAAAMMAAALAYEQGNYDTAATYLAKTGYGALPIVIGETGWKAIPSEGEYDRAHPVNQGMFFNLLNGWTAAGTGPKNIFWFEAFDEPWKGADDNWGLFNVDRQARYAIQGLYPASIWEPGAYTSANALYYLPVVQNPAVTTSPYTLYAQTIPSGAAVPAEPLAWSSWAGSSANPTTATAPQGSTTSMEIAPNPVSWGWGMALSYTDFADDLSAFNPSGIFNFSIKTNYPGRILVGFQTGDPIDLTAWNVFIPIGSGDYGYFNDGAWHQVSIPISAMTPWGSVGSGMQLSTYAQLDLTHVTTPFVIADIYGTTGKAASAGIDTTVYVDDIFWSK